MTPDPEFFFESKAHGEILNRLEIALRLNRGLSVIMGGIGTGKQLYLAYYLADLLTLVRTSSFTSLWIRPGKIHVNFWFI